MGTNPELEELCNELIGMGSKWRPFGKYLGLREEVLSEIDQTVPEENKFISMLIGRMKRGDLPWSTVIEALEDKTVGEDVLALTLRMKYQSKNEKPQKVYPPPTTVWNLLLFLKPSQMSTLKVLFSEYCHTLHTYNFCTM